MFTEQTGAQIILIKATFPQNYQLHGSTSESTLNDKGIDSTSMKFPKLLKLYRLSSDKHLYQ